MNVLIIKTGFSETFDITPYEMNISSLGDVLRSTVILHLFKGQNISWLTSPDALKLLNKNNLIQNLYTSMKDINFSNYDLIVNLERTPDVFEELTKIKFLKIAGFTSETEMVIDNKKLNFISWLNSKEVQTLNWSEKIYALFKKTWSGENYILSTAKSNSQDATMFDIGLNWQIGSKWPTKKWPKENWESLFDQINKNQKVSWQYGFDDIDYYISWINSCAIVITHDSLGFHIARALDKKIIILFGPTAHNQTPIGANSIALSMSKHPSFECLPCYKSVCENSINCMESIKVQDVLNALELIR